MAPVWQDSVLRHRAEWARRHPHLQRGSPSSWDGVRAQGGVHVGLGRASLGVESRGKAPRGRPGSPVWGAATAGWPPGGEALGQRAESEQISVKGADVGRGDSRDQRCWVDARDTETHACTRACVHTLTPTLVCAQLCPVVGLGNVASSGAPSARAWHLNVTQAPGGMSNSWWEVMEAKYKASLDHLCQRPGGSGSMAATRQRAREPSAQPCSVAKSGTVWASQ